jgi:hypothetical protein
MLKEFIEGDIQQDLSPTLLTMIGKSLAQLHQTPAPDYLPQAPDYGIEQFARVEEYAADSAFAAWLQQITAYLGLPQKAASASYLLSLRGKKLGYIISKCKGIGYLLEKSLHLYDSLHTF